MPMMERTGCRAVKAGTLTHCRFSNPMRKLCRDAARREFDMVMAWSVDRLGRSLQDLVGFLSELHAFKIDLFLRRPSSMALAPARCSASAARWRADLAAGMPSGAGQGRAGEST
jgi:Resolvase, N terminal domain